MHWCPPLTLTWVNYMSVSCLFSSSPFLLVLVSLLSQVFRGGLKCGNPTLHHKKDDPLVKCPLGLSDTNFGDGEKKKVCVVLPHVIKKCHFGLLDANFDDEKCVHSIAKQFTDLVIFTFYPYCSSDWRTVESQIESLIYNDIAILSPPHASTRKLRGVNLELNWVLIKDSWPIKLDYQILDWDGHFSSPFFNASRLAIVNNKI
jgi:hypothetical protein